MRMIDGYIKFASFAQEFQEARAWCYRNGFLPGLVIDASAEALKLKVKLSKQDAGAMFLQVLQRCAVNVAQCSGHGVTTHFGVVIFHARRSGCRTFPALMDVEGKIKVRKWELPRGDIRLRSVVILPSPLRPLVQPGCSAVRSQVARLLRREASQRRRCQAERFPSPYGVMVFIKTGM